MPSLSQRLRRASAAGGGAGGTDKLLGGVARRPFLARGWQALRWRGMTARGPRSNILRHNVAGRITLTGRCRRASEAQARIEPAGSDAAALLATVNTHHPPRPFRAGRTAISAQRSINVPPSALHESDATLCRRFLPSPYRAADYRCDITLKRRRKDGTADWR